MTTTQPAALPEPLGWYVVNNIGMATLCKDEAEAQLLAEDCDMVCLSQAPHRAVQLIALAALQPQPAAAVSDAEWWHGVLGSAGSDLLNLAKQWSDNEVHVYQFVNEAEKIVKAAAQRAILALRPRAVPSLDTLKQHLACDIECSVYENTVLPAIERWECHHGITAQGAQGGEAK